MNEFISDELPSEFKLENSRIMYVEINLLVSKVKQELVEFISPKLVKLFIIGIEDFKASKEMVSNQTILTLIMAMNFGFLVQEKIEMIAYMEGNME